MNFLDEAIKEAYTGLSNKDGGPFGAVIVKDNKIISSGHNTVLKEKDSTCHAEMNAIRNASKYLNTFNLSGCILYTTSEPCPMCLSAIIWSNIDYVFYGTNKKEVDAIGFRDDKIYNYFNGQNNILNIKKIESNSCQELLKNYQDTIY